MSSLNPTRDQPIRRAIARDYPRDKRRTACPEDRRDSQRIWSFREYLSLHLSRGHVGFTPMLEPYSSGETHGCQQNAR